MKSTTENSAQNSQEVKNLFTLSVPIRLIIYIAGIVILSFGITLNTKSLLGVSPIISMPYTISVLSGGALGF